MASRMISAPTSAFSNGPFVASQAHRSIFAPPAHVQASSFGMLGPAVQAAPVYSAPAESTYSVALSASPVVAQPTFATLSPAQPTYATLSPGSRTIVYEVPVDVNLDGLHAELHCRMSLIAGLEQQNTELRNVLDDAKESLSISLLERERLNAQVLDLQREIGRLQAELTLLQRKYEEVLDSNAKQAAQIADLEAEVAHLGGAQEPHVHKHGHIKGEDEIDIKLQEYFEAHPDFDLEYEKVATGKYHFGKPVDKKVTMKVQGKNVLVLSGGGWTEVVGWLDEVHHEHEEAKKELARNSKKRGSRSGAR